MRINGFEQIKGFYSWIFDNQDKNIKPQHISLYMFMLNQNNRNNWVEWFKMPFDLAMTGACISSKKTYYACLADLKDWGLIEYEKGVNNWKAPLVKVEVLKDTTSVPQSEPQHVPQVIPQQHPNTYPSSTTTDAATVPQGIPNIKPITYNNKPITSNDDDVEPQPSPSPFFTIHQIPKEIIIEKNEFTFLTTRKTGKSAEQLKVLLETFTQEQKALGKLGWQDIADCKKHFINWTNKQTDPVMIEPTAPKESVMARQKREAEERIRDGKK